jgi:arylsulfatase A
MELTVPMLEPRSRARGRSFVVAVVAAVIALVGTLGLEPVPCAEIARDGHDLPNIVIIYADDLGYGDLGCFGAREISTPRIDRLAREGVRLTNFYVAQAVCGASRAALLTGCYPNRIGLPGAPDHRARHGIHRDETTIAELLKPLGYATAVVGKWHLGHHEQFLPLEHGFDEYFGLPYSNDMWPKHPTAAPGAYPDLPLIDGKRIVETNPDQSLLTRRYTERAVDFIDRQRDRPFFLYVAHSMPHVPLFSSPPYRGRSKSGIYGDVVEEIDASVGAILDALERNDLTRRTLVLFTSDNGPWLSYGTHAGSAGALREGKGTTWEGGVRVPAVARLPGRIPAGSVSSEPMMTIDLLPTIAGLTRAKLPSLAFDGVDVLPWLTGAAGDRRAHEALWFYYENDQLQALRSGPWKLHFPHAYRTLAGQPGGKDGRPAPYSAAKTGLELYHLENDPGETKDLAATEADVVRMLEALAERARGELGDSLTGRIGTGVRSPGRLAEPGGTPDDARRPERKNEGSSR